MEDETHTGPHGPGCACHKDTDEIREQHIEELRDADVFAGVAITLDDDGEPSASIARAYDEDVPLPTMLGLQQMLDTELDDLIGGTGPGLSLLGAPDGMMAVTEEEAREMGLLDLIEDMGGPDMTAETDDDFDGVQINLEDDDE